VGTVLININVRVIVYDENKCLTNEKRQKKNMKNFKKIPKRYLLSVHLFDESIVLASKKRQKKIQFK